MSSAAPNPRWARRLATTLTVTAVEAMHDLPATPDPERTLRLFLKSAVAAVGAGGGEAWLETTAGEQSAGATPTRTPGLRIDVPIAMGGRRLGRLELDARPRGGSFSSRDLAALGSAAERLGSALGAQPVVDAWASR